MFQFNFEIRKHLVYPISKKFHSERSLDKFIVFLRSSLWAFTNAFYINSKLFY